jgi:spore coat polysaccharide biosynthesis protein SpsF (cytidylyltransferase family)
MGSSRLPGKVLASIAGRSVLAHCLDRLLAADVGPVLVATTIRPEDDGVELEAGRAGVRTVRGPVDDVLGRFVQAVSAWDGPYVIRATADNPLVDAEGPGRLLRVLDTGGDYCTEEGLPVGAAVEAMRTSVLSAPPPRPTTGSTSRRSSGSMRTVSSCGRCRRPSTCAVRACASPSTRGPTSSSSGASSITAPARRPSASRTPSRLPIAPRPGRAWRD